MSEIDNVSTRFSIEEDEFLMSCNQIVEEKKKHSREMNNFAKDMAVVMNIEKPTLIKCKDYHYYQGNGWGVNESGEYDPLIRVKGSKFPDRVSGPFIKFAEVIENLNSVGDLDFLEPYFKALETRGIVVNITKEKVDKHSAYDGFIENASSSQSTICNLADILNDDKRESAVDAGLVSKKNFSKALQIYNKMTHEKDPSSIINNMYIEGASDALFAQKATTAISGLISE